MARNFLTKTLTFCTLQTTFNRHDSMNCLMFLITTLINKTDNFCILSIFPVHQNGTHLLLFKISETIKQIQVFDVPVILIINLYYFVTLTRIKGFIFYFLFACGEHENMTKEVQKFSCGFLCSKPCSWKHVYTTFISMLEDFLKIKTVLNFTFKNFNERNFQSFIISGLVY